MLDSQLTDGELKRDGLLGTDRTRCGCRVTAQTETERFSVNKRNIFCQVLSEIFSVVTKQNIFIKQAKYFQSGTKQDPDLCYICDRREVSHLGSPITWWPDINKVFCSIKMSFREIILLSELSKNESTGDYLVPFLRCE